MHDEAFAQKMENELRSRRYSPEDLAKTLLWANINQDAAIEQERAYLAAVKRANARKRRSRSHTKDSPKS